MKKLFLFAFFLIFLAFNVNAIAEITYRFNADNVEIEAYNCLDSGCYTVGPFSGSFPDGKTTANGQINELKRWSEDDVDAFKRQSLNQEFNYLLVEDKTSQRGQGKDG